MLNTVPSDGSFKVKNALNWADVPSDELEKIFNPYIDLELNSSDVAWKKLDSDLKSYWLSRYIKRILFGWIKLIGVRNQKNIEMNYSSQWTNTSLEDNIKRNKAVPCVWGPRCFLAKSYGIKRVHQYLLAKFIDLSNPRTILEVGSGNGLNLFVLSSLFPGINFSGCELTKGGFEASLRIVAEKSLPTYIQDFSPLPAKDLGAHQKIEFTRGSAGSLPYSDNQFDLVFTVLALEQMEEIREEALSELARVTSRYIVMIEPFRDWNNKSLNRQRVVALDYFSAYISDLPKFGLRPTLIMEDIPNKLGYFANMVMAEKIS